MVKKFLDFLYSKIIHSGHNAAAAPMRPWLAHYPDGIDWHTSIPPKPLTTLLDEAAARWPGRRAVDFLGRYTGFAELKAQADKAAKGLQALGVGKGTRVGLFLPNCPQYLICYYGILKAGGTVVNFNPLAASEEIESQIKDAGCRVMVTLALDMLYPKLAPMLKSTPLETVVVGTLSEALPFPKNLLFPLLERKQVVRPERDAHHLTFQALLDNDGGFEPVTPDAEQDIAVLQYTGGTTGTPKGAALTHANLHANAQQTGQWFAGLEEGGETMLAVLPLFHVFAMTAVMNLSLHKGMTMILHPRFNLKNLLVDVAKKKPTLLMGVPTMFTAINQTPHPDKYDLSSLKFCISGGAGLPLEVKQRFEELSGCTLVEGYGLTESSPVAAVNPLFGVNKAGSIGLPLPQTTIEIRNPEKPDKRQKPGETGEICIRGPQVMQGYWQRPEETADILHDGLLFTGDLGYMDEEGYTFIVDRKKELILSGGYNVYPRHVEEALYQHPDVVEAAVVGKPHKYLGQKVVAYVVLKDGSKDSEHELFEFLKPKVARYALPRDIKFRKELPKSMIGKILKKELQ